MAAWNESWKPIDVADRRDLFLKSLPKYLQDAIIDDPISVGILGEIVRKKLNVFWLDRITDLQWTALMRNHIPGLTKHYNKDKELEKLDGTQLLAMMEDPHVNEVIHWESEVYWVDEMKDEEIAMLISKYGNKDSLKSEIADLTRKLDEQEEAKEVKCRCFRPKMYMCATCDVWRDHMNDPWQKGAPKSFKSKPAKTPNKSSYVSYDSYGSQWEDDNEWWNLYIGKDKHEANIIHLNGYDFYASSLWNTRANDDFVPDFGLYFDWSWRPYWRNEHIEWPDFQVPRDLSIGFEQILSAVEAAQDGLMVEFGCIGGHGRTGTALAVAGVILGMKPQEAMNHVQDVYCVHAIESDVQEWYVEWCYAQVHGLAEPEYKPKYGRFTGKPNGVPKGIPQGGQGKPPARSSTVCTMKEHFDYWEFGTKDCPANKSCGLWKMDVAKFESGVDPWLPGTMDPHIGIRGYWVPNPAKLNNNKLHTQHALEARQGCKCDTCRYLDRGFSAFLEPARKGPEWATWDEDMRALETRFKKTEWENEAGIMNVALADGTIRRVGIVDDFEPAPPKTKGTHGERRGEFIFVEGKGWVCEKLSTVKFEKINKGPNRNYKKLVKKERKQKRREERFAREEAK